MTIFPKRISVCVVSLCSLSSEMQAHGQIARAANGLGVDLWNYNAPNGANLRRAVEFLKSYNYASEKWPHSQKTKLKPGFLDEIVREMESSTYDSNITFPKLPTLRIAPDKRHFELEDGTPFFWLGDTAWELFHRLNENEAKIYLQNRAAKGFNVIQSVALAECNGLDVPNAYGDLPLFNQDPTRPNPAYFDHVDKVIAMAAQLGMRVALLPTWGDKFTIKWGVGPEIFTPKNARIYAAWLAARYKDAPVIWVLGGDRVPETRVHYAIIDAMAEGIRSVVGSRQLITYHPGGFKSSSSYFHDRTWLDLHMFQSGHGERERLNYEMTHHDRALEPRRPVVDGEPCYEDHPVRNRNADGAWFGDFEVRRAAYWSLLAGAAGHTYGHHSIWQMWTPIHKPVTQARTPWHQALDYPGAFQMGILRKNFELFPWTRLEPRNDILRNLPEQPAGAAIMAAVDAEKQFAFIYSPFGHSFSIVSDVLAVTKRTPVHAHWVDPRTGQVINLGKIKPDEGLFAFNPPFNPERGNDWLLVLQLRLIPSQD